MAGARLAPGDEAPDFTLPDADGNLVSLSSLRGQRVIVYFYPAALTPGCTKQACDFTAAMPDFGKLGLAVLGISPDARPSWPSSARRSTSPSRSCPTRTSRS